MGACSSAALSSGPKDQDASRPTYLSQSQATTGCNQPIAYRRGPQPAAKGTKSNLLHLKACSLRFLKCRKSQQYLNPKFLR